MMSMPTLSDLWTTFTTAHTARDTAADSFAVAKGELDEAEADLDTALAALAAARANNQNLDTPADDVAAAAVQHQSKLAAAATAEASFTTTRNDLRGAITALVNALTAIVN